MKTLDKKALVLIKEMKEKGVTYDRMVEPLTALEYTTPTGLKLRAITINVFANDNGLRSQKIHNHKRASKNIQIAHKNDDRLILEIVHSNLTKGKKVKMLEAIL